MMVFLPALISLVGMVGVSIGTALATGQPIGWAAIVALVWGTVGHLLPLPNKTSTPSGPNSLGGS